jgi:hypothetical protein
MQDELDLREGLVDGADAAGVFLEAGVGVTGHGPGLIDGDDECAHGGMVLRSRETGRA